jgi:hypothetical protein
MKTEAKAMRRSSIFWGSLLLLLGILLLLSNLGIFSFNVWAVFWPLVLILIGARMLWGFTRRREALQTQELSLPLEDVSQAEIQFHHGAGTLNILGQSNPGVLLSGDFYGGVEHSLSKSGSSARVRLDAPSFNASWDWIGFAPHRGFSWDIRLSPDIPLILDFRTGASESNLDLSQLKVTDLRLDTGASATNITFPANSGQTRANLHTGAAGLKIRIPDGVAAHIEVKSGLAGINIDQRRFPRTGLGYESTDFATAVNRAEIRIETGVGSVDVF